MSNQLIKRFHLLFKAFIIFITTMSVVNAQGGKEVPDIEKIYLHTDRNTYVVGEDLWYKVYSVYPYNNIPFSKSSLLYVELISPDAKILSRNKTFLEEGLGYGDFKLTDSIGVRPGKYQIRAYTNWNRNFGDDFVFKKTIEIIDVFEDAKNKNGANRSDKPKVASAKNETTINEYQIDFFPEGGSLLENTLCTVAFKATNKYGLPVEVNGKIFNAQNELITMFRTVHEGMGKFQF